jgi:hypothetical protein
VCFSFALLVLLNEQPESALRHRGAVCEMDWTNLLKMTSRRRRGKSPLAMESINDRYCGSPRGVIPSRLSQLALMTEWHREGRRSSIFCGYGNYARHLLENFVARCDPWLLA